MWLAFVFRKRYFAPKISSACYDTYMNKPLALTFDFGTQSVRACIYDAQGNCLAFEKKKYDPAYHSPKPGYAEMDPDYYLECLCQCTQKLVKEYPDLIPLIAGIELDCFRDSAVILDKDNKVIRPMILWLDSRMAKCEDKLPFVSRALFKLVGMSEVIRMNRRRTMANWIKENEPENFAKIVTYASVSTYFIYRLTGEMKDSPSDMTGHYPIDYQKKAWYKNPPKHLQGQIFSLRRDQLPELVDTQGVLGHINEAGAKLTGLPVGLPVFAGGSDKSCETLGSGVVDDKECAISLGTACTIETVSEKFIHPLPFLPAYPSVQKDRYNLDVQIYRGFWMINWFLKEFGAMPIRDLMIEDGDPSQFDAKLHEVPPGCDGLMLQPFWGAPLDHPEVRGSIIGFSESTTRQHLYRAIIEGIGYELRLAGEGFMKSLKHRFSVIRVSGGGSLSKGVCQILADIFGIPVETVQTNETSSLGAAIGVFLSLGVYKDAKEAVSNMVRVKDHFEPNEEAHRVYDQLFNDVYKHLYPRLKKTYQYLYRFSAK